MKINFRAFCITLATLGGAVLVVLFSRYVETSENRHTAQKLTSNFAKKIERISDVLELQLDSTRLQLILPTCNTSAINEKFFIHVFTNDKYGRPTAQPLNMDFDARKEDAFLTARKSNGQCIIEKNFADLDVRKVEVGQFTTPDEICCTVTWSRKFVFD